MKQTTVIIIALGLAIVGCLFVYWSSKPHIIYALANRTIDATFLILDKETHEAIPAATIEIWDDFEDEGGKKVATITTDESGKATYLLEKMNLEDVVGISAETRLVEVGRHPDGIGTIILGSHYCHVTAKGYLSLRYVVLANCWYEDKGYVKPDGIHRFEFRVELKRQ
jgi:hypothetical protein